MNQKVIGNPIRTHKTTHIFRKDKMKTRLNKIYDILVEIGAREEMREKFIICHIGKNYPHEWRFMGQLGFGGKLWRNYDNEFSVSCYSEDENVERKAIIKETNAKLIELLKGETVE